MPWRKAFQVGKSGAVDRKAFDLLAQRGAQARHQGIEQSVS
jgi:hypothetical protein